MIAMAVVRVLRTRDGRWRVEVRDSGVDLRYRGQLVLRRTTLGRVAEHLAEQGVASEDLVED